MRIIGVLDLLGGRAVHARGGRRASYAPVTAVSGSAIENGDAVALARAYRDRLGVSELYGADLDAILGHPTQDGLIAGVAALGAPLWLDAGVRSIEQAHHLLGLGSSRVVVGLETLPAYDALEAICAGLGGDRVAFSLDLRDGDLVVANGGIAREEPAHLVAARVARFGVGAVIVIDLARVGTGSGLDLDLIARVREAAPRLTLLVGGGIRSVEDCERLVDCGCDGVLVATALQDGRLGAAEVADIHRLQGRGNL